MVDKVIRYTKIYNVFIVQFLKTLLEYRVDFIIGIFSFIVTQFSSLFFIFIVFKEIPLLSGWSFTELILMYGVFLIPRGVDHLLTDNIWSIPAMIIRGELDRYLLMPINPLFSIISQKIDHNALGELAIGLYILLTVTPQLSIKLTMDKLFGFIIFIAIGFIIYTSIKLFFATLSFFVKNGLTIIMSVYQISEFAKYPLTIFPDIIQLLIKYILPFAFTAYYPTILLLEEGFNTLFLIEGVVIACVAWSVSYSFWEYGLSKYESSGN